MQRALKPHFQAPDQRVSVGIVASSAGVPGAAVVVEIRERCG